MNHFVSIIILCRNEEKFIEICLDSLLANDYPQDKMEILVVDGMSTDATREKVAAYIEKFPSVTMLDNPEKITPVAKNRGIRHAKGDIILIAGAHARYEKHYISKCVRYLETYQADNVGGILRAIPSEETLVAHAIAASLSHWFGAGNADFRIGSKKPVWVDTAFGGCFRKEVFEKIGLYNEKLIRSQDMEFNKRLKKAGGKILLAPDIINFYYPKATMKDFFLHNIQDGVWVLYPLKFGVSIFKLRHLIPLFFIGSLVVLTIMTLFDSPNYRLLLLGVVAIYVLCSLVFSLQMAIRKKRFILTPFLILAFLARHVGYGIGSFLGIIKMIK